MACFHCSPEVVTQEGADHTGLDAWLKCPRCGKRTANHVECARVSDDVRKVLRAEWNARRFAQPTQGEEKE